jgi:membrane-associated HD superfamily phosphohydrolase
MTIEKSLNNIASHLDKFDINVNKEKLLKICSNLLNDLIEKNKDITEESNRRIDELKEKINKLKTSLENNESEESAPDLKASAEDEDDLEDWIILDGDTNAPETLSTQAASPSSAPSSMPSSAPSYNASENSSAPTFSPSSIPSSAPSSVIGVSVLGASVTLSGSFNGDAFLGRYFHDDSDNNGGIC